MNTRQSTLLGPNITYGPQAPGQPPVWIVADGIRYVLSPPTTFGAPSNPVRSSTADPIYQPYIYQPDNNMGPTYVFGDYPVRITNLPKGSKVPKSGLFGTYPEHIKKHTSIPRAYSGCPKDVCPTTNSIMATISSFDTYS
jgi:hypothetical protein